MTKRKFFATTLQVTVLSEEPFEWATLADVDSAITDGGCSGEVKRMGNRLLDGKQAAQALLAQGSAPSFFRLTDTGEDLP